jgi:hypothetical protein
MSRHRIIPFLAVLGALSLTSCEQAARLTGPDLSNLESARLSTALDSTTVPAIADTAAAPVPVDPPAPSDSSAGPVQPPAPPADSVPAPDGKLDILQLASPLSPVRICGEISPEGGFLEYGPVRVDFPRYAMEAPTQVCMVLGGRDLEVTLEPYGLVFPLDAMPRLQLRFDGAPGYRASGMEIVYSNPATNEIYSVQPTWVNLLEMWAETLIDHFSTYAMAYD